MGFDIDRDCELSAAEREWLHVPEQRLLYAMIERAIRDLRTGPENEARAAYSWLFTENQDSARSRAFSFNWICECLNLDARRFRERIERSVVKQVAC